MWVLTIYLPLHMMSGEIKHLKNITWQINICTVLKEIKSQNCALSVCSVRLK